jgi:hypothetical protein
MIVIDPLSEFTDDGVDLNKTGQSRRVIKALTQIAREFRLVILLIHHLNKATSDKRQSALHRGAGSVSGIAGAARSVLMAAHDPTQPTRAVLASVKHNLSARPDSLSYEIESATVTEAGTTFTTSRLTWGERSALRADDLAAPPSTNGDGVREEAEAFLREFLAEGPRSVRDIQHECKQRGISFDGAVRRASTGLRVRKRWNTAGELDHTPARSLYVWLLP